MIRPKRIISLPWPNRDAHVPIRLEPKGGTLAATVKDEAALVWLRSRRGRLAVTPLEVECRDLHSYALPRVRAGQRAILGKY